MSVVNQQFFPNLTFPLIFIYEKLQIARPQCFHQRVVFLMSLVFPFTWAYRSGFVCLLWTDSFSQISFPLIFIYEKLQIACPHCFHQRVVFLMSLVFPFTWAYRSGFVCLLWTYSFVSQLYVSTDLHIRKASNCLSHCFHQRVVFLISLMCPSTLIT